MRSRFSFLPPFALAFAAVLAVGQEEDTNRSVFEEAYLKTPHAQSNENFGQVVAISGDTAVVSAPSGSALHVFVKRGRAWSHQARLPDSKTGDFALFGQSVALSGDIIVVGTPIDERAMTGLQGNEYDPPAFLAGAAYIFERSNGVWRKTAYLKPSKTKAYDGFGGSVAVSGNSVIIGAHGEGAVASPAPPWVSTSGAAYVFTKTAGVWSEQAYLKASHPEERGFGFSVAISGDTAIVGALDMPFFSTSGSAYVFARGPGGWQEQARFKDSHTGEFDGFGFCVGVSGDTAVVTGGIFASASGAAHVYVRGPDGWRPQARLKSSNWHQQDGFGESVAISGDTLVVGAPFESSDATGIDGNEANNGAEYSGAAYLFRRRDDRWSQLAYLKASQAEAGDRFGSSVGISGGHVVIGAPQEGHQDDTNQVAPGAAYIFRVLPPRAELTVVRSPDPFAPTRVGNRSQPQALVLRNSGTEPLSGLRVGALGAARREFHIRGRDARTLAPGRATRVEVIFQPKRTGGRHATLSITGNFRSTRVKISGEGTALSPRFPLGIE